MDDTQFSGTVRDNLGLTAGNDAKFDTGSLRHLYTVTVFYVEKLALHTIGLENDPPISHHPVHIEEKELYFMQTFFHIFPIGGNVV
jgi:hypothetical protein